MTMTSDMPQRELLPCWRCGSRAIVERTPSLPGFYHVECLNTKNCNAYGNFGSQQEAAEWWNTRAHEPQPGEALEVAERLVRDWASDVIQTGKTARFVAAIAAALTARDQAARVAIDGLLNDYRTEGCPDPECGVCRASKAARQAAETFLSSPPAAGSAR